jgi:hypothetical protein
MVEISTLPPVSGVGAVVPITTTTPTQATVVKLDDFWIGMISALAVIALLTLVGYMIYTMVRK